MSARSVQEYGGQTASKSHPPNRLRDMAKREIFLEEVKAWQARLLEVTVELRDMQKGMERSEVAGFLGNAGTFTSGIERCERYVDTLSLDLKRAIKNGKSLADQRDVLEQERTRLKVYHDKRKKK